MIAAVGTYALASNVSLPHTFQSGEIGMAADFNANFDALKTGVNDNDTRIAANDTSITANDDRITALEAANYVTRAEYNALEQRLAALEANTVLNLNNKFYLDESGAYPKAVFEGVNVKIVNGSGSTYNNENGLGNLIIGYNRDFDIAGEICSDGSYDNKDACEYAGEIWAVSQKTGSHNLVVGDDHNYTKSGGVVFGWANSINRISSSVTGGEGNLARGKNSSVSGGYQREAPDIYDWVAGALYQNN